LEGPNFEQLDPEGKVEKEGGAHLVPYGGEPAVEVKLNDLLVVPVPGALHYVRSRQTKISARKKHRRESEDSEFSIPAMDPKVKELTLPLQDLGFPGSTLTCTGELGLPCMHVVVYRSIERGALAVWAPRTLVYYDAPRVDANTQSYMEHKINDYLESHKMVTSQGARIVMATWCNRCKCFGCRTVTTYMPFRWAKHAILEGKKVVGSKVVKVMDKTKIALVFKNVQLFSDVSVGGKPRTRTMWWEESYLANITKQAGETAVNMAVVGGVGAAVGVSAYFLYRYAAKKWQVYWAGKVPLAVASITPLPPKASVVGVDVPAVVPAPLPPQPVAVLATAPNGVPAITPLSPLLGVAKQPDGKDVPLVYKQCATCTTRLRNPKAKWCAACSKIYKEKLAAAETKLAQAKLAAVEAQLAQAREAVVLAQAVANEAKRPPSPNRPPKNTLKAERAKDPKAFGGLCRSVQKFDKDTWVSVNRATCGKLWGKSEETLKDWIEKGWAKMIDTPERIKAIYSKGNRKAPVKSFAVNLHHIKWVCPKSYKQECKFDHGAAVSSQADVRAILKHWMCPRCFKDNTQDTCVCGLNRSSNKWWCTACGLWAPAKERCMRCNLTEEKIREGEKSSFAHASELAAAAQSGRGKGGKGKKSARSMEDNPMEEWEQDVVDKAIEKNMDDMMETRLDLDKMDEEYKNAAGKSWADICEEDEDLRNEYQEQKEQLQQLEEDVRAAREEQKRARSYGDSGYDMPSGWESGAAVQDNAQGKLVPSPMDRDAKTRLAINSYVVPMHFNGLNDPALKHVLKHIGWKTSLTLLQTKNGKVIAKAIRCGIKPDVKPKNPEGQIARLLLAALSVRKGELRKKKAAPAQAQGIMAARPPVMVAANESVGRIQSMVDLVLAGPDGKRQTKLVAWSGDYMLLRAFGKPIIATAKHNILNPANMKQVAKDVVFSNPGAYQPGALPGWTFKKPEESDKLKNWSWGRGWLIHNSLDLAILPAMMGWGIPSDMDGEDAKEGDLLAMLCWAVSKKYEGVNRPILNSGPFEKIVLTKVGNFKIEGLESISLGECQLGSARMSCAGGNSGTRVYDAVTGKTRGMHVAGNTTAETPARFIPISTIVKALGEIRHLILDPKAQALGSSHITGTHQLLPLSRAQPAPAQKNLSTSVASGPTSEESKASGPPPAKPNIAKGTLTSMTPSELKAVKDKTADEAKYRSYATVTAAQAGASTENLYTVLETETEDEAKQMAFEMNQDAQAAADMEFDAALAASLQGQEQTELSLEDDTTGSGQEATP